jgi:hypothetical protein
MPIRAEMRDRYPSDDPPTDRQPLTVRCGACDHRWVAAYLPMEMATVARVLKCMCCPSCGESSRRIFLDAGEPKTTGVSIVMEIAEP